MGDPGTQEKFTLPAYLYIYIVRKYAEDDWRVWEVIERTPTVEQWNKRYYTGSLMGSGDSIYSYTEQIIMPLADKFEGRIYAMASAVPLTFTETVTVNSTTEATLLGMKFSTSSPATIKENLHNLYSTPYNYTVDASYYGSFSGITHNVPYVYLILYHVAAKVDIKWSVETSKRINKADPSAAIRLTNMKACNLFTGNAYCFKPMENVVASAPLATGDTITIVRSEDEGLWWEGRYYFYTIPYTVGATPGTHFTLQMEMSTNGSSAKYRPTLNLSIDTSSPFVPWLRAMFNIGNQLTEKAETITP